MPSSGCKNKSIAFHLFFDVGSHSGVVAWWIDARITHQFASNLDDGFFVDLLENSFKRIGQSGFEYKSPRICYKHFQRAVAFYINLGTASDIPRVRHLVAIGSLTQLCKAMYASEPD